MVGRLPFYRSCFLWIFSNLHKEVTGLFCLMRLYFYIHYNRWISIARSTIHSYNDSRSSFHTEIFIKFNKLEMYIISALYTLDRFGLLFDVSQEIYIHVIIPFMYYVLSIDYHVCSTRSEI